MLEQLQMDLFELSKMVGRPVHHLTQNPCCEFTKGDLTIRILSPSKGRYHSISSMNKERNKKLLLQGESIAKRFLKF